ncbi:MAG: FAD-binding oxidoreductase [Gemmatimonadales bacterium]
MTSPPGFRGPFRTDLRARAAYAEGGGIYRVVPEAVAVPADTSDVLVLTGWAGRAGKQLIPRGAGSAMPGDNIGGGVMVDLTAMDGPRLRVDPARRSAATSPGIRLADLNTAAGRDGLRLPPDPSSSAFATAGGAVSTNAAGARSVKYGSVRRWVTALTLVTADAETIRLARGEPVPASGATARFAEADPFIQAGRSLVAQRTPRVRKNSSGYALGEYLASGDLIDLVIGAEGTLGFVTEVEWRLDRVPEVRAGLRVSLARLDDLTEAVEALLPLGPSALELLDRSFLDLVRASPGHAAEVAGLPGQVILLVEFEGSDPRTIRGVVGDAVRRLRTLASDVETAITPEEERRLWALRHAASPIIADLPPDRRSLQVIEDGCVPVQRTGEYIAGVRQAAAELEIPVVIFGHAGDGNVHVNILPDITRPGWEDDAARLLDSVTRLVAGLGGVPSGEHGTGRLRARYLEGIYGPEMMGLFRRVKDAFDPAGIFNPGIMLPDAREPVSDLKAGIRSVPIPDDIAAALREIEKRGGYRTDRLGLAGEDKG